jgi:hypothetical protein
MDMTKHLAVRPKNLVLDMNFTREGSHVLREVLRDVTAVFCSPHATERLTTLDRFVLAN